MEIGAEYRRRAIKAAQRLQASIDSKVVKQVDRMSRRRGIPEHRLVDQREVTVFKAFKNRKIEQKSGTIATLKRMASNSIARHATREGRHTR